MTSTFPRTATNNPNSHINEEVRNPSSSEENDTINLNDVIETINKN